MKEPMFHAGLTIKDWHALSLFEQLGNIGSEVGRAISAKKRGNVDRMNGALDRALELFDLTITDPKNQRKSCLKELCRAREVVCDFLFGENEYQSSPESLDKYFMQYALIARS